MNKTSKYGFILALVMTLIFGSTSAVSAKPIDTGQNYFMLNYGDQMWQADSGVFWFFYMTDFYDDTNDHLHIYGYDPNADIIIVNQDMPCTFTSKINFRKKIATFACSAINITVTFDKNSGLYETSGSRKEVNLYYAYSGPGTIEGNIIIDSVYYSINGSVSGDKNITVRESHTITK